MTKWIVEGIRRLRDREFIERIRDEKFVYEQRLRYELGQQFYDDLLGYLESAVNTIGNGMGFEGGARAKIWFRSKTAELGFNRVTQQITWNERRLWLYLFRDGAMLAELSGKATVGPHALAQAIVESLVKE